jgi:hypothetical protein
VNPEIFFWARRTAGLSLEEAANKLGIHDSHGVKLHSDWLRLKQARYRRRPLFKRRSKRLSRMGDIRLRKLFALGASTIMRRSPGNAAMRWHPDIQRNALPNPPRSNARKRSPYVSPSTHGA